ncbi:MAG: YkgJ family cysteine cluster protein [bacterium]|nr:YkgJ family cysteine cluster protein [bacterium]
MDIIDKNIERLTTYKKYLNTIQALINKYFEEQKDYIFCKKGCSHCCEKGCYPYSEIEFLYLYLGFLSLSVTEKIEISKRVEKLKTECEESKLEHDKFMYRCPFLRDTGECSVYDYRGLICRNFGIMHINLNNQITMPFCEDLGLNYSNVYNDETKKFDYEKVKEYGYKYIPKPYPITRASLMDKDLFEGEPLDFGETKTLLDWL